MTHPEQRNAHQEALSAEVQASAAKPSGHPFVQWLNSLSALVHDRALKSGWWDQDEDGNVIPRNDGEMIALMHSELSEALEALRHGNPQSEHLPAFSAVEEEMADVVIRIMDYCHAGKHRLGEAIIAKMAFNKTRPFRHGNKVF